MRWTFTTVGWKDQNSRLGNAMGIILPKTSLQVDAHLGFQRNVKLGVLQTQIGLRIGTKSTRVNPST